MATYKNITGEIIRVDDIGIGFISPTTQVGAHDKYIFFSKEVLETGFDWSQLFRVGEFLFSLGKAQKIDFQLRIFFTCELSEELN